MIFAIFGTASVKEIKPTFMLQRTVFGHSQIFTCHNSYEHLIQRRHDRRIWSTTGGHYLTRRGGADW